MGQWIKESIEELLLLFYDTYPEYSEKSNVCREIEHKKKLLAEKLMKKGIIDEERFESRVRSNMSDAVAEAYTFEYTFE